MATMGRPKVDEPADKRITVRFKEREYDVLLEYAKRHNKTVAQVIRLAVETQIFTDRV